MLIMRLFLAITIPQEIQIRISKLTNYFEPHGISIVEEAAYHITLLFLGERTEEDIGNILAAVRHAAELFAPFVVSIEGVSCFTMESPRVVYLSVGKGSDQIKRLHSQLESGFLQSGIRLKKEKGFIPHLTIARVRRLADKERILSFANEHRVEKLGTFTATGCSLMLSSTTSRGPSYSSLYEAQFLGA